MREIIARDRWRTHLQGRGEFYEKMAQELERLHREDREVGADVAALAVRAVKEATERARANRLTRNQHVLFRLGEMMARAEVAATFVRFAAGRGTRDYQPYFAPSAVKAMARICAREAAMDIANEALRWIRGSEGGDAPDLESALGLPAIHRACRGLVGDLDLVARAINEQDASNP
jgi:alkylation response protein AidB-like acyl-CoA dehydrogenase